MTIDEILLSNSYVLLSKDGTLYGDTKKVLSRLKPDFFTALSGKVGSSAKLGNAIVDVSAVKGKPDFLMICNHIDIKSLILEHGSIEIDANTGEMKTLTEVSIGKAQQALIHSIMNSNTGKVTIDGEVVYISKERNNNYVIKKSHDELVTIDDIINFGLMQKATNVTITNDSARYRADGKMYNLTKIYTEKDIAKMLDMYDKGIASILENGIYSTTKVYDRTAVNIHVIKDTRYTLVFDFIANKEHQLTDFFDKDWVDFMKSRNEADQGGIIVLSEKQNLPEIIPMFINSICSEDNVVMTYGKNISEIIPQHLEFSKSVPLASLVNINTDVVIIDFSIAVSQWDTLYEMVDNGAIVIVTVNESSMYMTLNMMIETFEKQYQYRKFIDTLLGINMISIQYQSNDADFDIKYDFIYNNKQFQILLGSKTYSKQDLEDKKYKHYFLTIAGSHKSIEETLQDILKHANEIGAHDISLSAGSPPAFRKGRDLVCTFIQEKLLPYMTESMFLEIVKDPLLQEKFRKDPGRGLPASYSVPGVGRYRVNVYSQRGSIAMSLRKIPSDIPTMDWCGLPERFQELMKHAKTGLVLVTGPTGSGKSTTLASIIGYYNETRPAKIITTEDPIEYLHNRKMALIEQIELGQDTDSFIHTLESNMRNNPDIMLIGEIRDAEVLSVAINAAVTGHLVFATMHTSGAVETIQRIIDMTPVEGRENIKSLVSQNLICTVTQQLLPKVGGGMVPAHEVMVINSAIRAAISEGTPKSIGAISNQLRSNREVGMRDMDYSIAVHVKNGKVSLQDAEMYAPNIDTVKRYVSSPNFK